MTTSAHPVYLSLANHLSEGRKTERGRRLITLIPALPEKEPEVHASHYIYYNNIYFLRIYEAIFDMVRVWEDGFELVLPSDTISKVSTVYPRIGIFTGDIPEMHSFTAVAATDSIRCDLKHADTKDQPPPPIVSRVGHPIAVCVELFLFDICFLE